MHVFALLAAAATYASAAVLPARDATVCNGHAELCDRSYGNITFFGAHDSFAFSSDPLALARDQEVNITQQLNLGVRLLQAQAHNHSDTINFCHTSCALFNGGTVADYLAEVKTWLDANPNEVLTLLFTNPDGASLPGQWDPAFKSAGIDAMAYVPPSTPMKQSDWPTLGELINSGKRVVVFLDAGADGSDGGTVPYIQQEFPNIWETPFSVTDASFPCSVDRTAGPLPNDEHMYMINHSLNTNLLGTGIITSDPEDAPTTNGLESIFAHANNCTQFADGRAPNFILMDFVNIGQGAQAADTLNGF
ncbi:hypothetical protein PLICRDRAFT_349496 [Plicaturopsis crispa FD-325 SS-3]|uniref:Unplaced genomic scaffold PLICRscaffold_16, whole genome shotgun sequence n=1 Tax=Plicaturopsis crispa FD-325 SS-3 TaxID=944288 RepID=A0A0C9T9M2_PLICR|nr:hypothetical protein PLICRDRAFT_349496 [Plicaturopsis crispa FD-325 SS-3]